MRNVKKVGGSFVSLLLVVLLLSSISVFAVEFSNQGFRYEKISGGAQLNGYTADSHLLNETTLTVPVNLAGNVVLTIADTAFKDNRQLEEIVFHSYLNSIGDFAFYGNTSLKSLTIPKSIKTIGSSAFYNCSSLQSVTFGGNGLSMISGFSFANCSQLTEFVIPGTVTKIDEYAFSNDKALKSVYIPRQVNTIIPNAFNNCFELTIYGVANSYAQTFAEENGIPFVAQNLINKQKLINTIALSKKVLDGNTEMYTAESIAELQNQYNYALEINQATFYTQEEIDTAANQLETAYAALQLKTQKQKLEEVLTAAKAILDNDADEYTEDSIAVLQQAYEDGQNVFIDNDAEQAAINSAVEKIEDAIDNLAEVEPAYMLGDLNGDELVDMRDVLIMQKGYARMFDFTEQELKCGDVTKDGIIDLYDVLMVRKYVAKQIPSLEID